MKINRITEKEYNYVNEVLNNSFRSSKGAEFMTKLEHQFCETFETNFSISHVNGTATMHSVLEAAGIGQGDEVIVPPLTMASTSLAVIHANATPVYADVEKDTLVISAKDIENKITPRTKAIITVSLYGLSPEMDEICSIAKKHNLILIEDNAQSFLSYYKGKLLGNFGDAASYSFQSSKHISSGEGGMTTTNNEELAIKIRKVTGLGYAALGSKKAKITKADIQNPNYTRHDALGWNYRMPELCCAVALAQVERLNELVEVRKVSASYYLDALEGCTWIKPQFVPEYCTSSYWAFACVLDTDKVSWEDFYQAFINNGGLPFYGAWKLTYQEPLFTENLFGRRNDYIAENYNEVSCPNAEYVQSRIIALKTNYWNTEDAQDQADILKKTILEFEDKF